MEELKTLVRKLENENDEEKQIKILQDIGKSLLCDYTIEFLGITVEPLWVEAYYFDKTKFPDCNTHLSEKQKNRFGQLYFHETGHGGFDICISENDDYYLSFLLKMSLINGEFKKQTDIETLLPKMGKSKEECENVKPALKRRKMSKDVVIGYAERVGLTKTCYADAELAMFQRDAVSKYAEYYKNGFRKSLSKYAEQYMREYIATHDQCTKKECDDECYKVFGWEPDNVRTLIKEHT